MFEGHVNNSFPPLKTGGELEGRGQVVTADVIGLHAGREDEVVTGSAQGATDGQVHDEVERLVEGGRIGIEDAGVGGAGTPPIGLGLLELAADVTMDGVGRPFQEVNVETGHRSAGQKIVRRPVGLGIGGRGAAKMQGAEDIGWVVANVFHDVDFAGSRPAAVHGILRHHP